MAKQQLVIESEDVESAIKEGLKRLGKKQGEAEIDILQDASQGLFGEDDQPARVRLSADGTDLKELMEYILSSILQLMGIDEFSIEVSIDEDFYRANVTSEDQQRFIIGPEGQTLNAIQHILQCAIRRHSDEPINLVVNAGNYRERRRERLERKASETCERVVAEQREIELDPMIAYERKIVHDVVDDIDEVKSTSIGEDANRRVVIRPKGMT